MEELIRDDGEIRECPKNKAILGFWKTLIMFYSYKREIIDYPFDEMIDALKLISMTVVWLLLFPALPFIKCWISVREAKAMVKAESK